MNENKSENNQEYINICAKIGDIQMTMEMMQLDLEACRVKAAQLLQEMRKNANPNKSS